MEESKDVNSMRVYELIRSLHTYEMSLSDSHQPWETSFKASKNETKEFESFKLIGIEELALVAKLIKDTMRF